MAENKNSFLLYTDLIHTLEKMPDDKAGLLFKHILRYVNDKNPVLDDLLIELTFEPIKQQFKRDLKKYESVCNRNKTNGLKGGRPKEENPNNPVGFSVTQTNPTEPKKPDSDNDTDSDTDNDIKKNIEKRKTSFASSLKNFVDEYGRDTVKEFYNYWTEPNRSKTKMRWEMEKTWDLNLRLKKWANNNFNKKNDNGKSGGNVVKLGTSEARIEALKNWGR